MGIEAENFQKVLETKAQSNKLDQEVNLSYSHDYLKMQAPCSHSSHHLVIICVYIMQTISQLEIYTIFHCTSGNRMVPSIVIAEIWAAA